MLDKAIEHMERHQSSISPTLRPELHHALQSGIEALKAIQDYRIGLVVDFNLPLPGETEE